MLSVSVSPGEASGQIWDDDLSVLCTCQVQSGAWAVTTVGCPVVTAAKPSLASGGGGGDGDGDDGGGDGGILETKKRGSVFSTHWVQF